VNHELFSDNIVDNSRELVHLAFLADSELESRKQAINIRE